MPRKTSFGIRNLEHECEFVSSRGIVRSTTTHMAEPQSSTRRIPREMAFRIWGDVGTIHLPVEALSRFVKWHMWRITRPFILITGDSDLSVSNEHVDPDILSKLLNNRLLTAWYAQNLVHSHPKLHPIPIGIDYHTLFQVKEEEANHSWGGGLSPLEQESQLKKVHFEAGPLLEKKCQAFSNWHFAANRGNRQECLQQTPEESIYFQPNFSERIESWLVNANYAFTSSPFGNGLDCHRTWEAILLGSIPVVVSSSLDPLYKDLPVLIIEKWSDLTIDRMSEERERMCQEKYNFSKLTLGYWVDTIYHRANEPISWLSIEDFRLSMKDHTPSGNKI